MPSQGTPNTHHAKDNPPIENLEEPKQSKVCVHDLDFLTASVASPRDKQMPESLNLPIAVFAIDKIAMAIPALPKQPNKSLIDGIRCLQEVLSHSTPVGVGQIAKELGLETTRVHRILRTLAASGMLRWTEKRKYAAGPAVPVLATQTMHASGFYKAIKPLSELHKDLNMITAMGVLWNRSVSYLYHADPDQPLEQAIGSFDIWPATISGLGVALLALESDESIRQLYAGHPMPKFDSIDQLLDKLAEVRECGYTQHNNTLALSINDNFQAAIGFSSPKIGPKSAHKYLPRLIQCKEAILAELGSTESS